ncbi:hypothetical protein BDV29DRAFT_77718 [Aspergillus leporis]|jgi:hypothetical protein|uniref:Uncharacterized protein n=1 Tax=Aspergillus leporis TaxID=41062 RepID=A0A5N5XB58_9EURO|nr:hypothetical protein BDV29DRAFT_77718 [Aspergillus leporis]
MEDLVEVSESRWSLLSVSGMLFTIPVYILDGSWYIGSGSGGIDPWMDFHQVQLGRKMEYLKMELLFGTSLFSLSEQHIVSANGFFSSFFLSFSLSFSLSFFFPLFIFPPLLSLPWIAALWV